MHRGLLRSAEGHQRSISAVTFAAEGQARRAKRRPAIDWWMAFVRAVTWWAPSCLLARLGYAPRERRVAFREKIALCAIIVLLWSVLIFTTFLMGPLLCPATSYKSRILRTDLAYYAANEPRPVTWALGRVYDAALAAAALGVPAASIQLRDVTEDLAISAEDGRCSYIKESILSDAACGLRGTCWDGTALAEVAPLRFIAYEWSDINNDTSLYVLNGAVIRMPPGGGAWSIFTDDAMNVQMAGVSGKDYTRALERLGDKGKRSQQCIGDHFAIGRVSQVTISCFALSLLQIIALIVIGAVILVRFVLAVGFSWFLSRQLDRMKMERKQERQNTAATERPPPPTGGSASLQALPPVVGDTIRAMYKVDHFGHQAGSIGEVTPDAYVILMVTCYSEGLSSLRTTLDSLAQTDYHDSRKLLLVIADGRILGEGNDQCTSDIIHGLMRIDCEMDDPHVVPAAYAAIADGPHRVNAARVYAGEYCSRGRYIPCILIEKCGGTLEEQQGSGGKRPGNRGKRDSQLILMNFMQRVLFNDRMTALDFDLFNKITWLMGVSPSVFEYVLMVDADTKVAVDSLGRMVSAMERDRAVMGLCGETRIANKAATWVSAIQVFEYYVSHHVGKAFESIFGGVTCLPGCFCMYRFRSTPLSERHGGASRGGDGKGCEAEHRHNSGRPPSSARMVPLLASPMIIGEYSTTVVDTLHKKNLLLLGEDRFLTTLMLKTFPRRKMIFVPAAYCKTVVPESFKVLLSQRRRWINSTVHNLMELVLVRDLCGVFCFSMQFIVFVELIGTVVLPAAILCTGVLVGLAFVEPLQELFPLAFLAIVLCSPAVLILITTRRVAYLYWMVIYLAALPIWNCILPIYAYWHFDDYTWGQTRKLSESGGPEGPTRSERRPSAEAVEVPLHLWAVWSRRLLGVPAPSEASAPSELSSPSGASAPIRMAAQRQ